MKPFLYLIFTAFLLSGCSGHGNKFVGKWRPLTFNTFPVDATLTIEKQGDHFVAINSKHSDQPSELTYDETNQTMTGRAGISFQIQYNSATGHILFVPSMLSGPTEFEIAE